jgi:hypothetical protein
MKEYIKKNGQPMFPWELDTDMTGVSISEADKNNGSPKQGDMIAVNPNNTSDKWLVAKKFFEDNYVENKISEKTLVNTDSNGAKKNVKDIEFWGDGDTFKLISKASSEAEGWMKSTKAMEITNVGCVVQVTTQQRNVDFTYSIAEAVTFVPGVCIKQNMMHDKCVSRELVLL